MQQGEIVVDGHELEVRMKMRGLTQRETAKLAGIHENTISGMKDSGAVRLSVVVAVCNALEIHPLEILRFEGFPPPHVGAPAMAIAAY